MTNRQYPTRFLEWWVGLMTRHYAAVIAMVVIFTAVVAFYCAENFRINTDLTGMISEKLRFRQLDKDLSAAFPDFSDTIVVVINAGTSDEAVRARKVMADTIRRDHGRFKSVTEPGAGSFFEKNGLLYLDVEELDALSERLSEAQPLMGLISNDFSINGMFGVLETVLKYQSGEGPTDKRLIFLTDRMRDAFDAAAHDHEYRMNWDGMLLDEKSAASQRRQFIMVKPYFDPADPDSGEAALVAVRSAIAQSGVDKSVTVRLTGDVVFAHDNYVTVMDSVGVATLLSIVFVGALLFVGLGSARLVMAGMATLFTGLIWTTGFALFAIGSLNLISVTFAVLFVGLGIDYSIQFCLRYRELVDKGSEQGEAVLTTAAGVGRGLLLSCITTAIGFYAFLPTPYEGVAELGLISGTGMFISFIINMTLLPALLTIMPLKKTGRRRIEILPRFLFPYKYARTVCITALLIGLAATAALPGVYFDYNPLNLYDRSSESIIAIKELFDNPDMPPWTISILADNEQSAKRIASSLKDVKEVRAAATIFDFVPDRQAEKMEIISDIALFMQKPPQMKIKPMDYGLKAAALDRFELALGKIRDSNRGQADHIDGLLKAVGLFKAKLKTPEEGTVAFERLERGMFSDLPGLLGRLDRLLHPSVVKREDIPEDIVRQYVSPEGIYRVQVFPKGDMLDRDSLASFVNAVKAVAPGATDAPVTIYETGNVVSSSFRLATLLALGAVIFVLLVELRNVKVTAMILLPLVLAILLTAAFSVLFSIPLNFANVIVLPLLIGVGVHSGIMFMIRYLGEPPEDGNMIGTSTSKAVFLSSLTMIISTSTLVLSNHRGISGMGALLTVCFALLLVSIIVLLPALTKVFQKENKG
jgi:uncharacterized protein